ncbi:hypothetical protein [Aquimarina sp. SS2-1]|uniref:NADase-type glycan-binding domain-containing protein n=1 Tax=Aquimarina besae TaxID=3342247 RepID=UPI00366D2DA7
MKSLLHKELTAKVGAICEETPDDNPCAGSQIYLTFLFDKERVQVSEKEISTCDKESIHNIGSYTWKLLDSKEIKVDFDPMMIKGTYAEHIFLELRDKQLIGKITHENGEVVAYAFEKTTNASHSVTDIKQEVKLATIDSVSITEIKGNTSGDIPTIFDFYKKEQIDEVDIWSDKMFGRCCSEADLSYSELLYFDITATIDNSKYPLKNVFDRRYRTAFVFKENDQVEISLKLKRNEESHKYHTELLVDDVLKTNDTLLKPFRLSLVNGYVKSEKTFKENARIKEVKVFLNKDYKGTIQLLDTPLVQEFALDFIFSKNDTVRLKPISYYKGTKYNDICISEIQSCLAHITHTSINKKYKVRELWEIGYALKKDKK